MSEKLCTLRTKGGGGGKYTETSLWTNGSPSSDFNAQTITISDSISNYKYIAIDYCYNKSNTGITSRVIYDVTDFKKAVKDDSTNHTISGLTIEGSNNVNYARPVFYISDTSIAFGLSSTLNGSGTYAAGAIPLEILGLNELAHKTVISMDLIGEISLPASTSTVTGTLTQNISDYKNLLITMTAYNGSALPTTGTNSPPLQFVDTDYFASNNIVGYYTAGNAGSMSAYSITMQKLSDTSIKFTRSNTSGNRTAYVYGIK